MHDPIAKARKAQQAVQTLIGNAAERLQQKNPDLTITQARVRIRKEHPEWAELERKIQRVGTKAQRTASNTTHNTVKARIDEAINKRAEWLSNQPGTHNLTLPQRRNKARSSLDGRTLTKLYRTNDANRPYHAIQKSGEHIEALAIIDRWLSLDA